MIKIKLTQQQLQALISAMVGWEPTNKPDKLVWGSSYTDDHNLLLLEHQYDFTMYLANYRQRNSKTSSVKFSSLQALSFMQMWVDRQLPPFPDEQAVIILVIGILDKASKEPKKVLI